MRLLHAAEGALDLALRPCRRPTPVLASRQVGANLHPEMLHHVVEDPALRDRAVVEVERLGDALEGEALLGLGRHGVEQEAQRRLDILAVDTAILLVADAAAVIDDAVEHERRRTTPRLHPGWCLDLLQVRGAEVELPERVAAQGLEPDRHGRSAHPLLVVTPAQEVAIDGGTPQQPGRRSHVPVGGLDPVLLEQGDGVPGREVPALAVRRPQLQGGDDLAVALQGGERERTRPTTIGPMQRTRAPLFAQLAVQGCTGDAVEPGGVGQKPGAFRITRRQLLQPPAERHHRLGRQPFRHPPRPCAAR